MTSPNLEPDGTEASSTVEHGELTATSDCRATGSESPTQHAMTSDANNSPVRPRTLDDEFEEVDDSSDAADDSEEDASDTGDASDASDTASVDRRFHSDAGEEMARDRFMHISRNLHFSSNTDPRAGTDRASKLGPIIDSLQERFGAGFVPPAIMAFDEAMLPSRSTFKRMRVYIKDKPHKWGTKLFMLCCSTTAYCIHLAHF
ncbi:hypothetical protein PC129_g1493 [Phytophthora cactorum]|nr:hypothetical protein PC111_g712 [Phytophthora cactorum]KAG2849735.1 hypothetical protein PC112_g60 [Phytophthora cactorum]KAG2869294.1 hypothetical protein PC113_g312 [Phytophthora cactorum]KAG2936403.1 hypothetical protein PC114_g260 [Phytophthora cactorum]KAG2998752.1 hypothetical protein PC118_g1107 [Phytophthora cactorum]